MSKIAVVDLSWVMHRYRYAFNNLSCVVDGKEIPTGHVYGAYKFVKDLELKGYNRIILAVDSKPTIRKEILSSYKENRKKADDSFETYNIQKDLDNILKMCTSLEHVYYVKREGYEADDIIASFIKKANENWDFYFRDDDILQTKGTYNLMVQFDKDMSVGSLCDRTEHIQKKYGLNLDYLPVIWKIIKGDAGDCIPIAVPRFPTKTILEICNKYDFSDIPSFEEIISMLGNAEYTGKMKETMSGLKDENSDVYKNLKLNYSLVCPLYLKDLGLVKFKCDSLSSVFSRYNIKMF